jgi:hypothetical protein
MTFLTLGALAVPLAPRLALAAETLGVEPQATAPPAAAGTEQAVVARYWELGRPRPFLAASLEAGFAYLKPRFGAGFGRPFWEWIGVEAYPLLALSGAGQYTGIAAGIPGLTLRLGERYYYPFSRSVLRPQRSYDRSDLDIKQGPTGDYLAFEGELTGTVALLRGSAFAVLTGYRTALVPEGYYVFEESLRVVMKPPYVYRARLGYLLALSKNGAIRMGATGEVIGLPGRDEFVVRAGLLGSVLIDAHLEAQASFIPVLAGPDQLGLSGGDFGQLGVRFRWATDSSLPPPARSAPPVTPE